MSYAADVIVIGAGASGLMFAIQAGQRGHKVLVLEKGRKIGLKILVSGGGRCNFTNTGADPRQQYLSDNQHFCISAMRRYTPSDFIAMVDAHAIDWHEKKLGQLFCDDSAKQIVQMLQDECDAAGVTIQRNAQITRISQTETGDYRLESADDTWLAPRVVIACGGLSIPKIASDLAFRTANAFDINVVPPRAALVPFTWNTRDKKQFVELSGMSAPARVTVNGTTFDESILFTHRGLSGPAILQASSYWREGDTVSIDLLPGIDAYEWLKDSRDSQPQQQLSTLLKTRLPNRLVAAIEGDPPEGWFVDARIADCSNRTFETLAERLNAWQFVPGGTEGYRTAEVTLGGIDCDELSSKTFEFKKFSGLYAIGEAIDVTGWLGGYNFQWAWASAWCCANEFGTKID